MRCTRLVVQYLISPSFIFSSLLISTCSFAAHAAEVGMNSSQRALVSELQATGGKIDIDRQRGTARFFGANRSNPVMVPGVSPGAPDTFNAMVIAEKYGSLFGLHSPGEELTVGREGKNGSGGGMVHYQQMFHGIPVMGGELVVNMDQGGALLSINGKTGAVPKTLAVTPVVDKAKASAAAIKAVAKWYGLSSTDFEVSEPELSVYDAHLIGPDSTAPAKLVWRLEVRPRKLAPIRELVLIDAQRGGIVLHFNQVDSAKSRRTYSANNTATLPGTLKCTEANGDTCTSGANTEADFAHLYAGATYDFYMKYHNRDSFDNAGATIISTVDFNDKTCPNAYWDGTQMVYCHGFPEADDVVAHELTHAVTDRTSRLFYYYQSGAINESFSDLWGEFVDLTDGYGNDSAAVRWKLGEDLSPVTGLGVLRDMKNPPAFHQPDRMRSNLYYTGTDDEGGVHINSGINNKAVYLLTDGDIFNGQTVTGLGITKVAKIYYEVQTNLLTSGADYLDLDNALSQACTNLIGTSGITNNDCNQVSAATAAVEMDQQPVANFNPEAQVCAAGKVVNDVFFDDMENGLGKWSLTTGSGNQTWAAANSAYGLYYATSGVESLFGADVDVISDQRATISVTVPSGQAYLHFRHAFDFEQDGTNYYDGGVLEYSTNNGSTWNNAMGLYDSGKYYNGTIYAGSNNPLKGSNGYVGVSNGYVSTRLNLAPLAGQNVKFRWRVGTDSDTGGLGWFLDDIRVYTCNAPNVPPTASAGAAQTAFRGATVTLDGRGSSDSDGTISSYSWVQTGGTTVALNNANSATPSFIAPATLATLTFQLTVTDNQGAAATATTKVTITNAPPVAKAGPAQTVNPGAPVSLNGSSSSDSDGNIVGYNWIQTGGITVTLNGASSATPNFVAPASATTLTFSLTVTDNDGGTGTDNTTVTVKEAPEVAVPSGGGGGGGCSLSKDGGGDPVMALVFLGALAVIWRRRNVRI